MSNPNGRFGVHGGQYVPETLMNAIIELEEAYNYYKANPDFQNELTQLLNDYAGRPSRLYYAEKMTKDLGGAKIYLKREDLNHTGAHFYDALKKDDLSFICEVKKASPSKGVIARDFPYLDIARDYEAAGADCISCLTEPKWFLGSDDIFREIRAAVSTPMLRKDFTVSDYQLYQSRLMGADCVLLICALLDTKTLAQYLAVCDELGLSALVETHDADEIRSAVAAGAKIIGVNNRNLKDFSVDFSNAARLRDRIPPEAVYVAESGVQSTQDVAALRSIGADAVLIGETLMRAPDKARRLAELRGNL